METGRSIETEKISLTSFLNFSEMTDNKNFDVKIIHH